MAGSLAPEFRALSLLADDTCDLRVDDARGTHRVVGKIGETLLSTLQSNGIAIGAVCGGNMICGTCHIWLPPMLGLDRPQPGSDEVALLELSQHYRPERSRLACQTLVHNGLSGLRLEVAPDD